MESFVRLFHNEVAISVCNEEDPNTLCSVESLEMLLGKDACDLEEVCAV